MIMTGRNIVLSLCILLGLSSVSAQQTAHRVELKPVLEMQYLLYQIEEEYRVDRSRVWVAGLSRGGYGAWRMAIQYPDRFAALVAALRKNGNPVRYTRYPNTGHNAWDQAFSDPELYTWLMSQKKK
jgi:predicted peptidase